MNAYRRCTVAAISQLRDGRNSMDIERQLLRMAILLALRETPCLTVEELRQRASELMALGEDRMRRLAAALRAQRN